MRQIFPETLQANRLGALVGRFVRAEALASRPIG